MKKFFNYAMMVMATLTITAFVACSSDDDDEVKSYKLKITLNPTDVEASNISNIKIVVKGTTKADTLALSAVSDQEITLTQGTYNITVSGKVKDEATAYVQGTATAELYAEKTVTVNLTKFNQSPLVFKTIHGFGSAQYYIGDGYVEIVNNSDEVQYLDQVIIAAPLGNLKAKSAWQENYPAYYQASNANYVIAFPGTGHDYPLQPGQFVVVADRAINHKLAYGEDESKREAYSVAPDLSNANWEIYLGKADIPDNESVPNMEIIYAGMPTMKMCLTGVGGKAYMLIKLPEGTTPIQFAADENNYKTMPNSTSSTLYMLFSTKYVLDAVDVYPATVDVADHYNYFLAADDASGIQNGPIYSAKCVRRKVSKIENGRAYYTDTNNSANDFKNGQDITPGVTPTTAD